MPMPNWYPFTVLKNYAKSAKKVVISRKQESRPYFYHRYPFSRSDLERNSKRPFLI